MSTRIDHAAEARRNIEGLHDYQSEQGLTDGSLLTVAIEAQVHATLALVEQQRLANVIEVAKWNSDALVRGARKVGDEPLDFEAEVARVDAMFADVQKGLGLS